MPSDEEPTLKASARKSNGSTKRKANGKAVNGTKLKGCMETQATGAILSEKNEEKVDLKIVKKWGVFSPQSFHGASKMRVGVHGTNELHCLAVKHIKWL